MTNTDISYSVITGWYANHKTRDYKVYGNEFVRSVECFDLWYYCINKFTNPEKIFIIDANSPIQPKFPKNDCINVIRMLRNHQHAAQSHTHLSGWSRTLLCGLMCGLANGSAYTVLIEQGSLFCGHDIIEREIEAYPDADIIVPTGTGTPQPIQTGIMIFRNEIVTQFINNYFNILAHDSIVTPEKKCTLAAKDMKIAFSSLPFGRRRPIDFNYQHMFIRHANLEEIQHFIQKINYGADSLQTYMARCKAELSHS
ncbi:hypothetical protein [Acetobacter sp. LMG 32666]|uniref:hypothetical protein n=1 Tax=Acetobacter sp. LMG 32666 TaxID=2959295 RepID=UPI0030C8AA9B